MKVLVLWSSPNKDGLTASAKNQMVAGLTVGGAEVEEIHLNRQKIEHCRACGNGWGTCLSQGGCGIKDDLAGIYKKMVEADGIVFVTAVYWWSMTETFKALIDRVRRMEPFKNRLLNEKRCMLVACAGGTGRGVIDCLMDMEKALTHMGMRTYDRIPVVRFNSPYMLPALEGAGKQYVNCLENGFDMYY